MITLADFRLKYPEFSASTNDRVTMALTEAEATTDATVFGALTDAAHAALAAHILASTPNGREARLNPKHNTSFDTVYLTERRRIEAVCCSHWVAP